MDLEIIHSTHGCTDLLQVICGNGSCCEFTFITAISYPETLYYSLPHSLTLIFLSFPLAPCSLRLGGGRINIDVPFGTEHPVSDSQLCEVLHWLLFTSKRLSQLTIPHPNYGVWASITVPGRTLPPIEKASNLIKCNYLFHNSYTIIAPIGTSCLS